MDLFITIFAHVLTFIGALIAIIGNTWDSGEIGIKKLRPTGWTAGIIAIIGIGLSVYQSVEDHRTKSVYENIALNDIRGGWRQLASPFFLLTWEVTGQKGKIGVEGLREILSKNLLAEFDSVNFSRQIEVPQYGTTPLGILTCKQSSVGMKIMESSVQNNTAVIPRDIAKGVKVLRKSPVFGRLLAAGCGTNIGKQADFGLFAGVFDTDETKAYINHLIALGDLLGDPGKKR